MILNHKESFYSMFYILDEVSINFVERFITNYASDFGFDISRSMKVLKMNTDQEKHCNVFKKRR